jgi:hypothetical protein
MLTTAAESGERHSAEGVHNRVTISALTGEPRTNPRYPQPTQSEAQIFPAVPDLPAVDWTSNPIRAGSEREAELMARQRIDDALNQPYSFRCR